METGGLKPEADAEGVAATGTVRAFSCEIFSRRSFCCCWLRTSCSCSLVSCDACDAMVCAIGAVAARTVEAIASLFEEKAAGALTTTTLGFDDVENNELAPITKTNMQPAMTSHFCFVVGILTAEDELVAIDIWFKAVVGAEVCGTDT